MLGQEQDAVREKAFNFAVRIVKLCQKLDEKTGTVHSFSENLFRTSTALGSSLDEANGGQSRPDFLHTVSTSLKDAKEAHYWLRLLSGSETVDEPQLSSLTEEAGELVEMLSKSLENVRPDRQVSILPISHFPPTIAEFSHE